MTQNESNKKAKRFPGISGRLVLALLIFAGFALYGLFFTVNEGEAVVVTRLGRPVRVLATPGPNWRLPAPSEQLSRVDLRRRITTTPQTASFTQDRKSVVVQSYIVWRVNDPLLFLQSTGDAGTAQMHLVGLTSAEKNTQLGQHRLDDLVSLRQESATDRIELAIKESVHEAASDKLGIAVDRIGFERITFPAENMPAVLDRMSAEREAEANRLRSEGTKLARQIRDEAHVQSQEILRDGKEEASRILADAQRQAGLILADSFKRDPSFYKFWSSLETCRQILGSKATLVLRSDQPPFDALTNPLADEQANELDSADSLVAPYLSSIETPTTDPSTNEQSNQRLLGVDNE